MSVGALEPQFYAVLVEKLGLDDSQLPQFDDFDKCRESLTQIFKTKTQQEWTKLFTNTDACVAPVLEFKDVADDPHNKARESFAVDKEGLIVPKPSPILSRTPGISGAIKHSSLPIGQHSREILMEAGYSKKEIDNFVSSGIVEQSHTKSKL